MQDDLKQWTSSPNHISLNIHMANSVIELHTSLIEACKRQDAILHDTIVDKGNIMMIKPLSRMFLARCRDAGLRLRLGEEQTEYKELQEMGRQVRAWRIQTGQSRVALAKKLGLNADKLLFLEMGNAQPEDFTELQLRQLGEIVSQRDSSKEFNDLRETRMDNLSFSCQPKSKN